MRKERGDKGSRGIVLLSCLSRTPGHLNFPEKLRTLSPSNKRESKKIIPKERIEGQEEVSLRRLPTNLLIRFNEVLNIKILDSEDRDNGIGI